MSDDSYISIRKPTEGIYKEKGSKFIAYAFPVSSEEQVKERLEEIRSLHPTARHACYAYLLGIHQDKYRANDDGEPSGTAGLPILGQIRSHEVTDVLVIVIRYFGGTKLGVSGLKTAYKTAAGDALGQAIKEEKILRSTFELRFDYPAMSDVMAILRSLNVEIKEQNFAESCHLIFSIRKKESEVVKEMFPKIGNLELRLINT